MALIDDVKLALRVSSNNYDSGEIIPIIEACKKDLELAGIKNIKDDNPLIKRVIVLYANWQFGFTDDAERFKGNYIALRDNMALSGMYTKTEAECGKV